MITKTEEAISEYRESCKYGSIISQRYPEWL